MATLEGPALPATKVDTKVTVAALVGATVSVVAWIADVATPWEMSSELVTALVVLGVAVVGLFVKNVRNALITIKGETMTTAAAAVAVLLYALSEGGLVMPEAVAGLVTTLVAVAIGYLRRDTRQA